MIYLDACIVIYAFEQHPVRAQRLLPLLRLPISIRPRPMI